MDAGDLFKLEGGFHFKVVISVPSLNREHVAIVGITDGKNCPDKTCLIDPSECRALTKPSAIFYKLSRDLPDSDLERQLSHGRLKLHGTVEAVLLKRIRDGAMSSAETPPIIRQILIQQGLVAISIEQDLITGHDLDPD